MHSNEHTKEVAERKKQRHQQPLQCNCTKECNHGVKHPIIFHLGWQNECTACGNSKPIASFQPQEKRSSTMDATGHKDTESQNQDGIGRRRGKTNQRRDWTNACAMPPTQEKRCRCCVANRRWQAKCHHVLWNKLHGGLHDCWTQGQAKLTA